MDLLIKSLFDAIEYQPEVPTYALSIFSSDQKDDALWEKPLVESPSYIQKRKYYFDDNHPRDLRWDRTLIILDENLAERIIQEFATDKDRCEALLVHCTRGKNRSPAIGIALNEIFELGNDTLSLLKQYNKLNKHVYETMLKVGEIII